MNIAIIIAGGTGSRTLQEVPKQFLCVDDKPIIIHTLEKFQNNENIEKIVVVALAGWEHVVEAYAKQFSLTKLTKVVSAGENRFLSIYNGVKLVQTFANDNDNVLIYDANRPMINNDIINDAIIKCEEFGCAGGALNSFDTLFSVDNESDGVVDIIDRNKVYRGMGPDTAKFGILLKEYDYYKEKEIYNYTTVEMLVKKGYKVAISKSSSKCIKITTAEDIEMFVALYESKKYKWLK